MAIQNRRGSYAEFDPDKMLSGEFGIVTSDDNTTSTGKGAYICFAPGDVQRLSTYEEVAAEVDGAFANSQELQNKIKTLTEDTLASHPEWTTTLANGSVVTSKLADGAVTTAKLESTLSGKIASAYSGDAAVTFTAASSRSNVASGDSVKTAFGKIAKWLSDIKDAAFRSVANNLTTASSGSSVLDAYQGKLLKDAIDTLRGEYLDKTHPVGSLYLSVNNTSPATLFGGTWEQIKDKFLLAAGSSYSAGTTGGEATHTLTVNEMPSHTHNLKFTKSGTTQSASANNVAFSWNNTWVEASNPSYTGGGAAHNNMPPYLAVYVWKRTA